MLKKHYSNPWVYYKMPYFSFLLPIPLKVFDSLPNYLAKLEKIKLNLTWITTPNQKKSIKVLLFSVSIYMWIVMWIY